MKIKIGAAIAGFVIVAGLFAWATLAGAQVMGIVARKSDASIEAKPGSYAGGKVTIARVVAPADSFVVVHLTDGDMPGKRIGVVPVKAGVSTDVEVPLNTAELTPELIAAVHMDRGKAGELEFDMKDPGRSPDKPYFVDGMELATKFDPR